MCSPFASNPSLSITIENKVSAAKKISISMAHATTTLASGLLQRAH